MNKKTKIEIKGIDKCEVKDCCGSNSEFCYRCKWIIEEMIFIQMGKVIL